MFEWNSRTTGKNCTFVCRLEARRQWGDQSPPDCRTAERHSLPLFVNNKYASALAPSSGLQRSTKIAHSSYTIRSSLGAAPHCTRTTPLNATDVMVQTNIGQQTVRMGVSDVAWGIMYNTKGVTACSLWDGKVYCMEWWTAQKCMDQILHKTGLCNIDKHTNNTGH